MIAGDLFEALPPALELVKAGIEAGLDEEAEAHAE
jgi:hypothetical protein